LLIACTGRMMYAGRRPVNRKSPAQIVMDLFTGAPAESVLITRRMPPGILTPAALMLPAIQTLLRILVLDSYSLNTLPQQPPRFQRLCTRRNSGLSQPPPPDLILI